MSESGKVGKGLGKRGAARRRKVLRNNIQRITKPAIRRLLRRGCVKRISILIYEEARNVFKVSVPRSRRALESVICDSVSYNEHSPRKTVVALHAVYTHTCQYHTLYGSGA